MKAKYLQTDRELLISILIDIENIEEKYNKTNNLIGGFYSLFIEKQLKLKQEITEQIKEIDSMILNLL